jgi:hypothetical protein
MCDILIFKERCKKESITVALRPWVTTLYMTAMGGLEVTLTERTF